MHISKYMCRVLCNEPQDVASWPARRSKAPGAPQVLSDPELLRQWQGECKEMADHIMKMRAAIKEDHIMAMRAALKEALYKSGSRKDWSHITEQTGMFCSSGLTLEQGAHEGRASCVHHPRWAYLDGWVDERQRALRGRGHPLGDQGVRKTRPLISPLHGALAGVAI